MNCLRSPLVGLKLSVGDRRVGAIYKEAAEPVATLVFGHGAGGDMHHRTMKAIAEAFSKVGIATLRFNFPFKEEGHARVDSKAVSVATVKAAVEFAATNYQTSLFLGGHSFGGRMASHAVVDYELNVAGMIFCSFPLHPRGKPSTARAEHLAAIRQPMLFLSGTRDALAEPDLLCSVVKVARAKLQWLETADHGYGILKRTRQRQDDVFDEMADYARDFVVSVTS
ncbi:MAG: alpha/beta family hydrolase [Pseudomonadota bacterium]|nr:alpha/beta family hydrolase [Pseudomonadota bacterium]